MNKLIDISLFFPAYNEEENLKASVSSAIRVLEKVSSRFEIIIVDDGSKDKTGAIADGLADKDARIRVIHHSPNQGYGAALWSGIQAARYDWVFFTDADLQFDLDELKRLVAYVPLFEVVLGYRAPRRDPFMRLVNAKGWNMLNRILFGLKVKDIDCAFKLFKRSLVSDLPIRSRGAAMSAEMLIRLQRKNIPFKEVPVTHLPRTRGSPTGAKPAVIIRAFKELFGLYRTELGPNIEGYVQAAKFGAVGLINTMVDLASYYVLTRYVLFFSSHVVSAKFLTFMLGTVSSFMLNRRFTFGLKAKPRIAEIFRFYASIALTVAVNVSALYVFHSILGIHDLIAAVISTLLTFSVGFIASKLWVFRKPDIVSKVLDFPAPHELKKPLNVKKVDWTEVARTSYE